MIPLLRFNMEILVFEKNFVLFMSLWFKIDLN